MYICMFCQKEVDDDHIHIGSWAINLTSCTPSRHSQITSFGTVKFWDESIECPEWPVKQDELKEFYERKVI